MWEWQSWKVFTGFMLLKLPADIAIQLIWVTWMKCRFFACSRNCFYSMSRFQENCWGLLVKKATPRMRCTRGGIMVDSCAKAHAQLIETWPPAAKKFQKLAAQLFLRNLHMCWYKTLQGIKRHIPLKVVSKVCWSQFWKNMYSFSIDFSFVGDCESASITVTRCYCSKGVTLKVLKPQRISKVFMGAVCQCLSPCSKTSMQCRPPSWPAKTGRRSEFILHGKAWCNLIGEHACYPLSDCLSGCIWPGSTMCPHLRQNVDRMISLYDSICQNMEKRTMEALLKLDNLEAPQRTPFHLSILRLTAGQKAVGTTLQSISLANRLNWFK